MIQLLFIIFIIIRSLSFIINIDKPVCKDCVHFVEPSHNDIGLGKCKLFGKKNIISGEILYEYASLCRNNKTECGINAKYYKNK